MAVLNLTDGLQQSFVGLPAEPKHVTVSGQTGGGAVQLSARYTQAVLCPLLDLKGQPNRIGESLQFPIDVGSPSEMGAQVIGAKDGATINVTIEIV